MTELFFRLEKLLFHKGIFFQCSVFFVCPPLFPPFSCLWSSCGKIHLIFFSLSCVESLSLRSFRPLRPWERPHCALDARVSTRVVRAKPSERERAFRVRIGRNVWLKVESWV